MRDAPVKARLTIERLEVTVERLDERLAPRRCSPANRIRWRGAWYRLDGPRAAGRATVYVRPGSDPATLLVYADATGSDDVFAGLATREGDA